VAALKEARRAIRQRNAREHERGVIIDYAPSAYLSNSDVISLHQHGASDDAVVLAIYQHFPLFNTRLQDLDDLSKQGLSDRLIRAVLSNGFVQYALAPPVGGRDPLLTLVDGRILYQAVGYAESAGPGDFDVGCLDLREFRRVDETVTLHLKEWHELPAARHQSGRRTGHPLLDAPLSVSLAKTGREGAKVRPEIYV
jgi:hypothetical protein